MATGRRAPSVKEWAGRSAPAAKSLSISVPFVVYFVSQALKVPVPVEMGGVQLDDDSFPASAFFTTFTRMLTSHRHILRIVNHVVAHFRWNGSSGSDCPPSCVCLRGAATAVTVCTETSIGTNCPPFHQPSSAKVCAKKALHDPKTIPAMVNSAQTSESHRATNKTALKAAIKAYEERGEK